MVEYSIIITENVSNSTLDKLIDSNLDSTKKLIILYGLASALSYSHLHGILHQNLKTKLIFLDEFLFLKITSFGMQEELEIIEDENVNPFELAIHNEYRAPEVLSNLNFSTASDVYSYAMVAYELISGEQAYTEATDFDIKDVLVYHKRPVLKESIPKCHRDLIIKCWAQESKERPTFDEIVYHLKTNKDFINDSINKEEFEEYIKMVDQSFDKCRENKSFKVIVDYLQADNDVFTAYTIHYNKLNMPKRIRFSIDMGSVNLKLFEKQKKIGEGCFGSVYKAVNKETGEVCAIKISKFATNICKEEIIIDLTREIEIISRLNHPCILKFIGYSPKNFKNQSKPSIVTELVSGRSLDAVLK